MRRIIALMVAAIMVVPAPLVSQSNVGPDILNYHLTLPKANQLLAAMDDMTKYMTSRPDFPTVMVAIMRLTPDERRNQMEKDPKAMAILEANKLTSADYITGVPALRMALQAAQNGTAAPTASVSAANLAFAKAHLAELKPKMDAIDGIKP